MTDEPTGLRKAQREAYAAWIAAREARQEAYAMLGHAVAHGCYSETRDRFIARALAAVEVVKAAEAALDAADRDGVPGAEVCECGQGGATAPLDCPCCGGRTS